MLLAFFAIWLSWQFYKASTASAEQMSQAARAIQSGVAQLDRLFSSLYADTFSMMRDTVTDIRKRALEPPAPIARDIQDAVAGQVEEHLKVLLADLDKQAAAIAELVMVPGTKPTEVRQQVERVVDRAISGTRSIEDAARTDPLASLARGAVLTALGGTTGYPQPGKKTVGEILRFPSIPSYTGVVRAERAIKELAAEGIVTINGEVAPETEVELTEKGRATMRETFDRSEREGAERRERMRRDDERLRRQEHQR